MATISELNSLGCPWEQTQALWKCGKSVEAVQACNHVPVPLPQQGHSKIPFLALQLLDFCLSILTLCSSYMEVPTYLSLKSSDNGVGGEQASWFLPLWAPTKFFQRLLRQSKRSVIPVAYPEPLCLMAKEDFPCVLTNTVFLTDSLLMCVFLKSTPCFTCKNFMDANCRAKWFGSSLPACIEHASTFHLY